MTPDQIFESVQEAFVEALGLEEDEVTPEAKVFEDLGAESLDLLEIVFLLERAFDIKIPRDGVKEASQEGIDPSDYERDGVLTPLALEKLRELMPEVPAEELVEGMTPNDIPKLFRVATFVNIVTRLLEIKDAEA
ncbi:acyl carrier protein [Myxococcota bacterium]|nr:acyl carrier protein [Myxococcota bacterium]